MENGYELFAIGAAHSIRNIQGWESTARKEEWPWNR